MATDAVKRTSYNASVCHKAPAYIKSIPDKLQSMRLGLSKSTTTTRGGEWVQRVILYKKFKDKSTVAKTSSCTTQINFQDKGLHTFASFWFVVCEKLKLHHKKTTS